MLFVVEATKEQGVATRVWRRAFGLRQDVSLITTDAIGCDRRFRGTTGATR